MVKVSKFTLVYCLLAFISLWVTHVQNNYMCMLNQYKMHNIVCSIVRSPSNLSALKNIDSNKVDDTYTYNKIGESLRLSLKQSIDKQQISHNTYKFCIMGCLNIDIDNFHKFYKILHILSITQYSHIFVFSNSFTIVKANQFLRWFSDKAHSPPSLI